MTLTARSIAALIATAIALVATPASAIDERIYFFNTPRVEAFGDPPYAAVTLSQDGTSVGFLIEVYDNLNLRLNAGGSNAVFFFNATGVAAGDIGNIVDKADRNFGVVQPGVNSSFGQFTYGIVCISRCTNPVVGDLLAFTVANATFADFEVESKGGSPNAQFAVDVFQSGSASTVPLAVILVATPVPEPSTYVLLLFGLGVTGFVAHRRKAFARLTPRLR